MSLVLCADRVTSRIWRDNVGSNRICRGCHALTSRATTWKSSVFMVMRLKQSLLPLNYDYDIINVRKTLGTNSKQISVSNAEYRDHMFSMKCVDVVDVVEWLAKYYITCHRIIEQSLSSLRFMIRRANEISRTHVSQAPNQIPLLRQKKQTFSVFCKSKLLLSRQARLSVHSHLISVWAFDSHPTPLHPTPSAPTHTFAHNLRHICPHTPPIAQRNQSYAVFNSTCVVSSTSTIIHTYLPTIADCRSLDPTRHAPQYQ